MGEDLLQDLIDYEDGILDPDETLDLFSSLVRTGLVWELQGHYGRTASGLIQAGVLTPSGKRAT